MPNVSCLFILIHQRFNCFECLYPEVEPVSSADAAKTQNEPVASQSEENKDLDGNYDSEYTYCIKSFQVTHTRVAQHFVRCEICLKFPNIVRRGCKNNKSPKITTEPGTRFRTQTGLQHFFFSALVIFSIFL